MAKKKNDLPADDVLADETGGIAGAWSPVYATEDERESLTYISADLRPLAARIDSLNLDTTNVRDHGEDDLPVHQASLREFGIQRAAVVQAGTGKILAGNGMALAAGRNGWKFIPITFGEFDDKQARAFALADNAVGTLAGWNEINLAKIAAESEKLFDDFKLQEMTSALMADVQAQLEAAAAEAEKEAEEAEQKAGKETTMRPEDVHLSHRVIATCKDQEAQIKLLAELTNQGYECLLSTLHIKN